MWGAATSSYQVEGGNINSDWWEWEKRAGLKEVSGSACRHYELYKKDFDLAKLLNHNAHRLSTEWSRIEPEEGEFSQKEIKHYTDVMFALRERNIEPVVTLHHFTNPAWFARLGGWQDKKAVGYFLRYVEKIAGALSGTVRYWVTINEPLVYAYYSYVTGLWPPQKKSLLAGKSVVSNLALAHIESYRLIHGIYKKRGLSNPRISIAKNMRAFVPCGTLLKNKFATYLRNRLYNFGLIERLLREKALDFIGVNYYTRELVDVKHLAVSHLKKNYLDWDIYPQGLSDLLIRLKRYGLPVFILENGICTPDDSERWDFIREHLKSLSHAAEHGVKLLGYLYWSLLDNYEWDKGFGPRFGLIGVDYKTYERTPKPSALKYAEVAKTGRL